jgi:hypothetical protein
MGLGQEGDRRGAGIGGTDSGAEIGEQLAAETLAVAREVRLCGGWLSPIGFVHQRLEPTGAGVQADQIAAAHLGERPRSAASGVTWIAAGTLPEARSTAARI